MENKKSFKDLVDELLSNRNDLIDEIYKINSSLFFLTEATATKIEHMQDEYTNDDYKEFSYGFIIQMNSIRKKLNELISEYDEKVENIGTKILLVNRELKKELLEKNFDFEIDFTKKEKR
ncbi:hypothetical protein [Aliarcobacter butzleri]|uniref:Uncharacterized protein n=1 Tax=Aliarcobacter butzleri L351 TaxID=1447259 RepID=A0A837J936_9BACT|nr:hypothetical protein [Aliarcobacter butzleri]KLE02927.1 hypothetical protein AF76_00240 [Aliarcobacter butzleri L351]KLE14047.1 hypothetical protein AF75_00965 [Aliarcobacter butzleri L350]